MSAKLILEKITVACELTGTEMSGMAKAAMADELLNYPLDVVLSALSRCQKEHRGRLTLPAIISYISEMDGRPGAEEAWASYPKDELSSAVVTNETSEAMQAAWNLVQLNDMIGARMAFKEVYERLVAHNRANNIPYKWQPTLGYDIAGRELALSDAVNKNRIGVDRALHLLPYEAQERFLDSVQKTPRKLLATPAQAENIKKLKELTNKIRLVKNNE